MDSIKNNFLFPDRIIAYSALAHLQEKIAERCEALPRFFDSLTGWGRYREKVIGRLKTGLPVRDTDNAEQSVTVARMDLGKSLMLEDVDVYFDDDFYIPVHVYSNREGNMSGSAVIVCPDYGQRKNTPDIINVCMELAARGIVALAMEYDGTGERADRPDCNSDINNVNAAACVLGITGIGLRVMNNIAALNYLKIRGDVSPDRIGITGLCHGAVAAWFTAALREDLKAAALLCGVSTYEAIALEYMGKTTFYRDYVPECLKLQGIWHCIGPFVYGLLDYADIQHVIACIAPRPLFVQNSIIDIHWPLSGFAKTREFAENIYSLYNSERNCRFLLMKENHAYTGRFLSNIANWSAKVL